MSARMTEQFGSKWRTTDGFIAGYLPNFILVKLCRNWKKLKWNIRLLLSATVLHLCGSKYAFLYLFLCRAFTLNLVRTHEVRPDLFNENRQMVTLVGFTSLRWEERVSSDPQDHAVRSSLLVPRLIKGEWKSRVAQNGQMWPDSRGQCSTSGTGVPKNRLWNSGGTEVVAPPSGYPCVALVARPGEISGTDSLQENLRTDFIKTINARHKDKRLAISETVILAAWNVRGLTYIET
jgi:hypothetical protein